MGSPIIPVKSPIRKIDRVPEILKMFQLAHQDGMAEVQIGRGRIECPPSPAAACPWCAISRASRKSDLADDLRRALLDISDLFINGNEVRHENRL